MRIDVKKLILIFVFCLIGCANGVYTPPDSGFLVSDASVTLLQFDSGYCEDWSTDDCYIAPSDQPVYADCNVVGFDVALPNQLIKRMIAYYEGANGCDELRSRFNAFSQCVRAWWDVHHWAIENGNTDMSMCL